jgi:hypothetical protein
MQTAFALPFEVWFPDEPFFSSGGHVTVSVQSRDGVDSAAFDSIVEVMHLFVAFAETGGLCGSHLSPDRSSMKVPSYHASREGTLTFEFEECRIDDRALIVLCDLLLHKDRAPLVGSLSISRRQEKRPAKPVTRGYSTYPGLYRELPFAFLDCNPESGAYTFSAQLAHPLGDKARHELELAFGAWKDLILAGGFALEPALPEDNYVEPDDPFVDFERSLEWTVFKLRAHSASIHAVVNLFAAFHYRSQPLTALTIA